MNIHGNVEHLSAFIAYHVHDTRLITPEQDKQQTCGISFMGLMDPKK